jgi:hypothetical protein
MNQFTRNEFAWGLRPFTSTMSVHSFYWFVALLVFARYGGAALTWFLVFEVLGMCLYARWLTGRAPYDEGATADTQRCA